MLFCGEINFVVVEVRSDFKLFGGYLRSSRLN